MYVTLSVCCRRNMDSFPSVRSHNPTVLSADALANTCLQVHHYFEVIKWLLVKPRIWNSIWIYKYLLLFFVNIKSCLLHKCRMMISQQMFSSQSKMKCSKKESVAWLTLLVDSMTGQGQRLYGWECPSSGKEHFDCNLKIWNTR